MPEYLKKLIADALHTGGSIVAYDEHGEMVSCYGAGMGETMLTLLLEHTCELNPTWTFGSFREDPQDLFVQPEVPPVEGELVLPYTDESKSA